MTKKQKTYLFVIILLMVVGILVQKQLNSQKIEPLPRLIAHAGGDAYGISLTNSLDAIESSYEEGYQLIEIDFGYTTDGVPVCIHDWGNANWLMNIEKSTTPMSIEEFRNAKSILNLQLLTLDTLQEWLRGHPSVSIITDVKENNLELLRTMKEEYPEMSKRIIPQIYSFEEYNEVSELGFKKIILTLYRINSLDQDIVNFCKNNKLIAVTMDQIHGNSKLPRMLSEIGIPSYVHTINTFSDYKNLRNNEVYGVYTDYFQPNSWINE